MATIQQPTWTLDELLNIIDNRLETRTGPIPETIGGLRADCKEFAGGNIVHGLRLKALQSGNIARIISAFGEKHYDLADACITFEDLLKLQPDSHLLKGIRGIVETQDGLYVAIDASAVNAALKNGGMSYFTVRENETVKYITKDGNLVQEQVSEVVLLPYDRSLIKFTPSQFRAINVPEIKRKDIIYDRDLKQEEIVKDGKVMPNTAWGILYPAELVIPLVDEIFKFNKSKWNYDANMGLFLPSGPKNNAEMRALLVNWLWLRSRLDGRDVLGYVRGYVSCRLIGVDEKYAAGIAQKLAP